MLPVVEPLAQAERLCDLQERDAELAAAVGQDYEVLLVGRGRPCVSRRPTGCSVASLRLIPRPDMMSSVEDIE
jgi:hypothetical protein